MVSKSVYFIVEVVVEAHGVNDDPQRGKQKFDEDMIRLLKDIIRLQCVSLNLIGWEANNNNQMVGDRSEFGAQK